MLNRLKRILQNNYVEGNRFWKMGFFIKKKGTGAIEIMHNKMIFISAKREMPCAHHY